MRIRVRAGPTNAIARAMEAKPETESSAPFMFKASENCGAFEISGVIA